MFLALLLGCGQRPTNPTRDIVVVFSVDTLGEAAARDGGWCERLKGVFRPYGLDLACLEGAVSPSSWTGEAHTRLLFPSHTQGALRALHTPACGTEPFLATIRASIGGRYLFGADNMVLSSSGMEGCTLTETQWAQGTDRYDDTHDEPEVLARVPEADRPVHRTIDAYEEALRTGDAVELFVNALEPGGHQPRCWFDPTTPACDELWTVAASYGLWDVDADRASTWLDSDAMNAFIRLYATRLRDQEMRWRGLFWDTTLEAMARHADPFVDARLRRILDATRDAGRLGDLHVVILGDHGENPCVAHSAEDLDLNCGHNGIPTEFTAFVPVYVSPVSLAEEWQAGQVVGDRSQPWSTVNVAHGLVRHLEVPTPVDWGPLEPLGAAASWTCKTPEAAGGASGVRADGDVALRCIAGACTATSFVLPDDAGSEPTIVDPVPAELADWIGEPDWFTEACGG